jgi:uncharacterized DUF497 family protein
MTDDFEWDRAKAAANFKKHGVKFEHAALAFEDPFALIEIDERSLPPDGPGSRRHFGGRVHRTGGAFLHYFCALGDRL